MSEEDEQSLADLRYAGTWIQGRWLSRVMRDAVYRFGPRDGELSAHGRRRRMGWVKLVIPLDLDEFLVYAPRGDGSEVRRLIELL